MKISLRVMVIWLILMICILTIGFGALSKNMIVSDVTADIRPNTDIRITKVLIDSSNSSDYVSNSYEYNVGSIMSSFVLNNIGSKITYAVDVSVYGNVNMAIKSITDSTSNSELKVSVS